MVKNKELKNLYIFLTSKNPDVYINVLGYCVENYSIQDVRFLEITEDRIQIESTKNRLANFRETILEQLGNLTAGEYKYKDQSKNNEIRVKNIQIDLEQKQLYTNVAKSISQRSDIDVIAYSELDEWLGEHAENNILVDVSGVSKDYLLDVYTLLLFNNIRDIYSFKLYKRPTFDEKDLIHNLDFSRREYEYINLAQSSYTKNSVVIKDTSFSQLANLDKFIEVVAQKQAGLFIRIYFVVALILFVAITFLVFLYRGYWSVFEPVVAIVALFVPYILSLISKITGKRYSLEITTLHKRIYQSRLNNLRRLII